MKVSCQMNLNGENMNKIILAIGMATIDYIITPSNEYSQLGGAVFYQTATLNQLKSPSISIISIGKDDKKLLKDLENTVVIPTEKTMKYTNIYDKTLKRRQKATLPKNTILPSDITINLENVSSVLLSPLSPTDIPPQTITYFKERGIRTILSAQGYLRKTDDDENIIERKWKNIGLYLKDTDILFLDEDETKKSFDINKITDETVYKIARKYELEQIIITRAEKGSTVYTKNQRYNIPAIKTEKEIDATGLGDTYIAAYISKLEECDDIYLAGLFASITAKEKLECAGPLKSNKEKIERELDKCR